MWNSLRKMFIPKIIIAVLMLSCFETSYGKECSDCIVFQSCPEAKDLAINRKDEVSISKFIESFCGYEYLQLQRIPKICCSDFTISARNVDEDAEAPAAEDYIKTHPNLKLLPTSCGDIDGKKISGGEIAKLYEFPWMALLSYNTRLGLQFKCSGSIVNSRYILTAGHCVSSNEKIVGVRIGEFDIRYKTDCQGEEPQLVCESHLQDIRVEDIIVHQNFTRQPDTQNDVALIRLKTPIDFAYKNAFPICLPVTQKLRKVPLAGMMGVVAGWGLTEADIYSPVLLKVNISIKTDEECRSLISNRSPEDESGRVLKEICAGENRKDSCKGDSGSPLMIQGVYEGWDRYIQYGIVSRGPIDCGTEPGVYTDVTKFVAWILDNIKE